MMPGFGSLLFLATLPAIASALTAPPLRASTASARTSSAAPVTLRVLARGALTAVLSLSATSARELVSTRLIAMPTPTLAVEAWLKPPPAVHSTGSTLEDSVKALLRMVASSSTSASALLLTSLITSVPFKPKVAPPPPAMASEMMRSLLVACTATLSAAPRSSTLQVRAPGVPLADSLMPSITTPSRITAAVVLLSVVWPIEAPRPVALLPPGRRPAMNR